MYIHITPHKTCAAQTQRCAEHIEVAAEVPPRLLDAIRCGHLALMAAMTEALTGTAGVGAFPDKLAQQHLEFMRGARSAMPAERTLSYSDLFKRIQEPGRMAFSGALAFTEYEKRIASDIDRFRALIDHPKPTSWSVEVDELVRLLQVFPDILEKCVAAAAHRYLNGPNEDIRDGLHRVRAVLSQLSVKLLA